MATDRVRVCCWCYSCCHCGDHDAAPEGCDGQTHLKTSCRKIWRELPERAPEARRSGPRPAPSPAGRPPRSPPAGTREKHEEQGPAAPPRPDRSSAATDPTSPASPWSPPAWSVDWLCTAAWPDPPAGRSPTVPEPPSASVGTACRLALVVAGGLILRRRALKEYGRLAAGLGLIAVAACSLLHVWTGGPGFDGPTSELREAGGWSGWWRASRCVRCSPDGGRPRCCWRPWASAPSWSGAPPSGPPAATR